ncbi:hypothetical protein EMILIAHAH_159 [Bacillus phage vB_BanH_Emiliahah]|nr:hypothetical protein EMILIAHAH_159 [Bacillus phage vB_BanH_Emiliahah]
MKKPSNINYEKHPFMTKWVIPLIIALTCLTLVIGIVDGDWWLTAYSAFGSIYIVCVFIMYVQVKVSKKFAIFLVVYSILIACSAAYSMWTQDWYHGIMDGFLALMNLSILKKRYSEQEETIEEGK